MSLSILNNIAALYAENNLTSTQSSLQTTLQQLSSGSRINSGADDPAGLAVSDGLGANEAALTQSSQNATDGVGLLQTADGALSQVTSLLDQAVTLATESANGTLTSGQVSSANQEYQNILSQIGNIGSTTNFNSSNVFSASATNIVVTDGTTGGLNTYADIVGALNTASVGTTAAAAVTTSAIAPTTTSPSVAVSNQAGVYTFTPNSGSDTLSGNLSFSVGTGTTQNITVAAGTSLTSLKNQLNANSSFTAAGLSASLNNSSTALVITGPTSGANAAANTINFSGTSLNDSVNASLAPASATAAVAATSTTSTLTFGNSAALGDTLSGNLTFKVGNGATQTFTLAAGTTLNAAANTGIVTQLNAAGSAFAAAGLTASINTSGTPVLTVTGPTGSSSTITLGTGTIADNTHTASTITAGATGTAATPGVETITLANAGDTFGTAATLTVGGQSIDLSGGAQTAATVAATINTLGGTANLAGYSASAANGVLTITGKSDGSALAITTGGTFQDGGGTAITHAVTTAAATGTSSTSSIVPTGATVGDSLSGAISWSQGGNTGSLTLAAGSTLSAAGQAGSVIDQLNNNAAFHTVAGLTASLSGTHIIVTGAAGTASAITLTAPTLVDTSAATQTVANNTITGAAGTAGTSTLTLNNAGDVFGGSVNINSNGAGAVGVNLAGLNGAQAALAITNNATLSGEGVSAAWNSTSKVLTITGNTSGSSLAVSGSSLTDNSVLTGATSTIAAVGGPSGGATTTFTLGSANDTVAGNLSVVVGNTGLAKDNLSLTVAAGTTGAEFASQINGNSSFQAAGVTASYNSSNYQVTLTGPTGSTNTLNTSGTALTDSTSAAPQAGANFTAAGVATLTAQTASNVLTTVTAAVADVAYQRGTIGADVNELTSASSVASAEQVNLTSAQNSVKATDYGQAATNLSKYQILSQTGISALAQANSVQQEVLKLLQ
jgi:flagellin